MAYLLPGRNPTLVDVGPGHPESRATLFQALEAAGQPIETIRQVVLTHTHLDHAGNAGALQELASTPIAIHAHAAGRGELTAFEAHQAMRMDLVRRAAEAAAVPRPLLELCLDHCMARWRLGGPVAPDVVHPLADGDRLDAGDVEWNVLHTPGHAPDHICLHHPASGVLISGDLLLRAVPALPLLEPRHADGSRPPTLANLIASLRRIGHLTVHVAWPGHGPPIRAHRLLVARRLAELRARLQVTRAAVAEGASTLWDIARWLGYAAEPDTLFLALSETVACTDWLVDRGWLARHVDEGVVRLELRKPA